MTTPPPVFRRGKKKKAQGCPSAVAVAEQHIPPVAETNRATAANGISGFVHCMQCLREMPPGTSPREWARLEAGFTKVGIQVRCVRHECNVLHIDFEGQKHPGETRPR